MKRVPVDADSPTNYRWLFFWLTVAYAVACGLQALGVWH